MKQEIWGTLTGEKNVWIYTLKHLNILSTVKYVYDESLENI